jgi:signal transduction histidine kinase
MMDAVRRRKVMEGPATLALGLTVLALVAIAVAGFFLADTQSDQRRDLRERYVERTSVASSLLDALFRVAFTAQAEEAAERYGDADGITQAQLDADARRDENAYRVILNAAGEVVQASSSAPAQVDDRAVRRALASGVGLSSVREGTSPVVETAVAFETPQGRRVQVSASPAALFRSFLAGTLRPLPTLDDSVAYVLDGRGQSLGGSREGGGRATDPAPGLVAASREMRGSFQRDGRTEFVASAPLAGSDWRVVLTASEKDLYSSVSGPGRWAPWVILVLGALALVAVAFLVWRLLRTNKELALSRVRLQERATELERSNADLEQFAYAASHDLSEPLRTVAGFSQLLRARYEGRLDPEADEFIGHMSAGVDRMQQLIDDLLLYSRAGRTPPRAEEVELEEVLAEVLEWIAPSIRERDARVTHDPLPVVRGERGQIAQVLQNLVGNAIKFTAHGQVPEVHVSAARQGDQWRVSVRDNGIGVDADAEVIFKMFARLHPVDAYPGTGIGLALAKRIIESHGGRIWVEPAPQGGSVFSFTLPAAVRVGGPVPVRS